MKPQSLLALLLLAGLALPAGAAELTLVDSFDGQDRLGWQVHAGHWERRDGAYHVMGSGQTYASDAVFADVAVEADCRITHPGAIPADWVGILLGANTRVGGGSAPYLVYLRYSGHVEVFHVAQIIAAKPTRAGESFAAGRPVSLAVSVKGKRLTVKVDGEACLECDLPEYRGGSIGLSTYDVTADFDNLRVQGRTFGNTILGEVLRLPSFEPAPGARVEIYHSMDGYDSPLTRSTTADAQGRFELRDLPAKEKGYWVRCGQPGFGGDNGWFVTVTESAPTTLELHLIPAPPHSILVDSAGLARTNGFRQVADPQCFGGSRIEVKARRPASARPQWWAEYRFEVPRDGDYVPYFAAGLYPQPHYWSDYRWSIDGAAPQQASKTLTLEGPRYGDRSTMAWARGPLQRLKAGRHTLRLILRDPAPHPPGSGSRSYAWSFDALALAEAPSLLSPVRGRRVATPRPELRWRASPGARCTVQYSHEPDFRNGTVTVGGVAAGRLMPAQPLADGVYYWRVKALGAEESPYGSTFTRSERFVVATEAPAIRGVRVVSRTPQDAVLEWETDEPCTSVVRYGLSGLEYTQSVPASERPSRRHRVRLAGLQPMTYAYYAVEATDPEGQRSTTLRRGFCTPRGPIGGRSSPFGIFGQTLVYAKQMAEAGAGWYSDYWDWATLEPSRGTFNWEQAELRMQRARDAGVNLMVTFWGSPAWVRPSHPEHFTFGPDDLRDARAFFRAAAAHCKGRMDWWLPWIEPNVPRDMTFGCPGGYWASRPHARSYAAYQRAAYQGAKAGNPDCRVVGMNTAGVDLDFIRKCYDEGAADDFDVMNVHYYAISAPFEEQNPEKLFADLRALMAEYGDGEKPILCSEGGGASSGVAGTTEETQADHIVRIFILTIANNIDKLCWTFELDEKEYGSKRVDMIMWMGLFRFDPRTNPGNPVGQPKPSYTAFRTMTQSLLGTEYTGPVKLGAGVRAYRFAGKEGTVTVAWAEKGEKDVLLPVSGTRVTLTNRKGETQEAAPANSRLKLHLTASPVFVREE